MNGLTLACSTTNGVAVWHVSVGAGQSASLTGAWLRESSEGMDSLTFGRVLLEGRDAIDAGLSELAEEVRETQRQLDSAFTEWRSKSKTNVMAPRWPEVASGPDFQGPEAIGTPVYMVQPLALARWAQAILTAWAETETLRVARSFLVTEDAPDVRMFPPRWLADRIPAVSS